MVLNASSTVSISDHDECEEDRSVSESSDGTKGYSMVHRETAFVQKSKTLVALMLLATAGLVVSYTYIFLKGEEEAAFQNAFNLYATIITEATHYNAINMIEAFQGTADTIISYSTTAKLTWPYVTIPDVETRFQHARTTSFAEAIALVPLINQEQHYLWEKYTLIHKSWINESLQLYEDQGYQIQAQTNLNLTKLGTIESNEIGNWETSSFAPIWQISPPPVDASVVNTNILQDPLILKLAASVENNRHAIFSGVHDVKYITDRLLKVGDDDANLVDEYNFGMKGMHNHDHHGHRARKLQSNMEMDSEFDIMSAGELEMQTDKESKEGEASVTIGHHKENHFSHDETKTGYQMHSENAGNGNHMDHDADMKDHSQKEDVQAHMEHVSHVESSIDSQLHNEGTESNMDHSTHTDHSAHMDQSTHTDHSAHMDHDKHMGHKSHNDHGIHNEHEAQTELKKSEDVTPRSLLLQPLYDSLNRSNQKFVGLLVGVIQWDSYLTDLLPEAVDGIVCVIGNSCGDRFSYEIVGNSTKYLGYGDIHNNDFDDLEVHTFFGQFHAQGYHCHYEMSIYPTKEFRSKYESEKPFLFTIAVALIFTITGFLFAVFVGLVDRRQNKVMSTAMRANAIVSSLFPSNVRARLMKDAAQQEKTNRDMSTSRSGFFEAAPKMRLNSFLKDGDDAEKENQLFRTKPIADLFPEATVLFADIVGFTAWSSVREPSQVFQLLETIYHSFDQIAKRRRVFKVETVGDCYVAVTGLPEPRKDHALVMARFARECMDKMHEMTKKLEVLLGPDTGDLNLRSGLHSGPVTAGVLRGEKSRFQLFGDTVNTASRMESNGVRGRIHVSQETAKLLESAGKSKWLIPRQGTVNAKGKGELKTFWLLLNRDDDASSCGRSSDGSEEVLQTVVSQSNQRLTNQANDYLLSPKMQRLVDWNVDQLARLLKAVVARRKVLKRLSSSAKVSPSNWDMKRSGTVLEEVKEVITLPQFDAKAFRTIESPDSIVLPSEAVAELHDYVSQVCKMYRDNPFHNFEHASHVTMSVCKLLSRIVAPNDVKCDKQNSFDSNKLASALHDHTYGITSDPLTQFACAFSALIHDLDHTGVPNAQLVKESTDLAQKYKGQSVAEQNSVDLAWELLMDQKYTNLRNVIYSDFSEFSRFRQLVVNSVMATDICDKELKALRNARWEKAFSGEKPVDLDEDRNRKATIVIEHIIQASDISHTMQHWHVYRKWNERLFREMYLAYKLGRSETDPSEFWYKGEIGFFDFYIIPLAKKLKDCGVFGVSSDEYLNYALKNREEWEAKGEAVVEGMLTSIENDSVFSGALVALRDIGEKESDDFN